MPNHLGKLTGHDVPMLLTCWCHCILATASNIHVKQRKLVPISKNRNEYTKHTEEQQHNTRYVKRWRHNKSCILLDDTELGTIPNMTRLLAATMQISVNNYYYHHHYHSFFHLPVIFLGQHWLAQKLCCGTCSGAYLVAWHLCSIIRHMNKVTLCWTQILLKWATIFQWEYHVHNQAS